MTIIDRIDSIRTVPILLNIIIIDKMIIHNETRVINIVIYLYYENATLAY